MTLLAVYFICILEYDLLLAVYFVCILEYDLLLAVYFICILEHRNNVGQKANSSDFFLFVFKMGCKAAETTLNTNNTFGPRTSHECTVQWWLKKFCKGNESLEDEECSVQPSEVDKDQMRASLKRILLQLHKKLPKNSMSTILWSFSI